MDVDLSYLHDHLQLQQGLPYTPDWSAAPDFLRMIAEHVLQRRPQTILECSSGLTTLVLARCCQMNERGRVVSLENGEEYAETSREYLARYELQAFAEVIHAPLETVTVDGTDYHWYRRDGLPSDPIDMLVIDGPPGSIQPQSRYPALPLLYDRLADGCRIFLDDAAREDERAIIGRWRMQWPGLVHEYIENERGCSVLTINRTN